MNVTVFVGDAGTDTVGVTPIDFVCACVSVRVIDALAACDSVSVRRFVDVGGRVRVLLVVVVSAADALGVLAALVVAVMPSVVVPVRVLRVTVAVRGGM